MPERLATHDLKRLGEPGPPYVAVTTTPVSELVNGLEAVGVPFVTLDAARMTNLEDFYIAITDAFALPAYFGQNLDALRDVLTDLSWLETPPKVVVFENAQSLLSDDEDRAFERVLSVFREVAADLSTAAVPPEAFHVVLAETEGRLAELDRRLGVLEA